VTSYGMMFVERYDFVLNDIGHTRLTGDPLTYDLSTPFALRAPEVILHAGYGTKTYICHRLSDF